MAVWVTVLALRRPLPQPFSDSEARATNLNSFVLALRKKNQKGTSQVSVTPTQADCLCSAAPPLALSAGSDGCLSCIAKLSNPYPSGSTSPAPPPHLPSPQPIINQSIQHPFLPYSSNYSVFSTLRLQVPRTSCLHQASTPTSPASAASTH